jgi:hypothetical protein
LLIVLIRLLALGLFYWFVLRMWFLRWGATAAEVAEPAGGTLSGVNRSAVLAITTAATPDLVWPWLAQMGYGRGGLYSYDWLDRLFGYLDSPSTNEILPEFQELRAGDEIPSGAPEASLCELSSAIGSSFSAAGAKALNGCGSFVFPPSMDEHAWYLVVGDARRAPCARGCSCVSWSRRPSS